MTLYRLKLAGHQELCPENPFPKWTAQPHSLLHHLALIQNPVPSYLLGLVFPATSL